MSGEVSMVHGSREFIYADIRADRVLDTQAISLAVAPYNAEPTWLTAEWTGTPGKFRSARILLDGTLARGMYTVYAKITDNPEAPILRVGQLKVV